MYNLIGASNLVATAIITLSSLAVNLGVINTANISYKHNNPNKTSPGTKELSLTNLRKVYAKIIPNRSFKIQFLVKNQLTVIVRPIKNPKSEAKV